MEFSKDTGKKAAKVVSPPLLLAHNAALSLAPFGTYSSPRLRLHLAAAFFFPAFSLKKMLLGQAGEKKKINGVNIKSTTTNTKAMETLMKLLHGMSFPMMFFVGLTIRLIVNARQFNRRGLGGLQHFNNYFIGLITLFIEWVLKWGALALILWGAWGWLFGHSGQ